MLVILSVRCFLISQFKLILPSSRPLTLFPHSMSYHLTHYWVISVWLLPIYLCPLECKLYESRDYFCLLLYLSLLEYLNRYSTNICYMNEWMNNISLMIIKAYPGKHTLTQNLCGLNHHSLSRLSFRWWCSEYIFYFSWTLRYNYYQKFLLVWYIDSYSVKCKNSALYSQQLLWDFQYPFPSHGFQTSKSWGPRILLGVEGRERKTEALFLELLVFLLVEAHLADLKGTTQSQI